MKISNSFLPFLLPVRNLSLSSLFGGNKQLKLAELIPGQFILLLCQATPAARLNGTRMLWGPVSFRGHFISYICAIYIFVSSFLPLIPKTEHAGWGVGGGGGEDKFKHNRITLKTKCNPTLHRAISSPTFFPPFLSRRTSVNCDCLLLQSQINVINTHTNIQAHLELS